MLNLNTSAYVIGTVKIQDLESYQTSRPSISVSGAYVFRPAVVDGVSAANAWRQFGRMYQFMVGDSSLTY